MSKPTDDTLRDWIKYCSLSENPDYEMVIVAAKELIELRERTRWIPVTEKLPEYHKECLVFYLARGLMFKAEYCHDGWCDASGEISDELLENVTHWMMLPKPPEVKE